MEARFVSRGGTPLFWRSSRSSAVRFVSVRVGFAGTPHPYLMFADHVQVNSFSRKTLSRGTLKFGHEKAYHNRVGPGVPSDVAWAIEGCNEQEIPFRSLEHLRSSEAALQKFSSSHALKS